MYTETWNVSATLKNIYDWKLMKTAQTLTKYNFNPPEKNVTFNTWVEILFLLWVLVRL